jgi:hypothetical protein
VLTIPELIRDLDAMPRKLAIARQALNEAKRAVDLRKDAVKDLEADAIAEVSMELDDKGKAKYSNKESREAAARKRLGPTYTAPLLQAEIDKQNAEITVGQLEDTEKSLYSQLDAAIAESRGEMLRELTKCLLEFARLEGLRLAQKESTHA